MIQKIIKEHTKTNYKYLDPEPDGYIIPEGPTEKTLKINQNYLQTKRLLADSNNEWICKTIMTTSRAIKKKQVRLYRWA